LIFFLNSNYPSLHGGSRAGGLNSSYANKSHDSLNNSDGGNSLPATPRSGVKKGRANSPPRRAKSNENLKDSSQAKRSQPHVRAASGHGSAPHLNNIVNEATGSQSLNSSRRSKTDMSEYTDDSDEE
jgi:hypothetical protein